MFRWRCIKGCDAILRGAPRFQSFWHDTFPPTPRLRWCSVKKVRHSDWRFGLVLLTADAVEVDCVIQSRARKNHKVNVPLNGPVFGFDFISSQNSLIITNGSSQTSPTSTGAQHKTNIAGAGPGRGCRCEGGPVFSLSVHLWKYGPRPVFCR